ncbi:MAG TPA: hypothetical protein DGT21_03800 [Armatimonadetes bacterium]|nr:hypothetical protein [Armatimonadota bacterium]
MVLSNATTGRACMRTLLVWLTFASSAHCWAVPAAQGTEYLRTIAIGMDHRAEQVTAVGGEALHETLCSDAYIARRASLHEDDGGVGAASRSRNHGHYLVRFLLGPSSFSHEVQALVAPGGAETWGFPLRPVGVIGGPYFMRSSCRDGACESLVRSPDGPMGQVLPQQFDLPGPLQPPFGTWLSLSLSWHWWSAHLRNEGMRLQLVDKATMGEVECLCVVQEYGSDDRQGMRKLWVAPSLGFAPIREEALIVHRDEPRRGTRVIHTWGDYRQTTDGWACPWEYTYDCYMYSPGVEKPWSHGHRVHILRLAVGSTADVDGAEWLRFPVGTKLVVHPDALPPSERVPQEHLLAEMQRSYAPWSVAERRAQHLLLPPDDPEFAEANAEYLKPLDGSELEGSVR